MISTVLEETDGRKIRYIGHSLGTTQLFYAMQSSQTKQFLEDSLLQVIATAPVFIPKVDSAMDLSFILYSTYETAFIYSNM